MITIPKGWDPSRFESPEDKFVELARKRAEEPQPMPARKAWHQALKTGHDPEGLYTLNKGLLPSLRGQEFLEIQREIKTKEHYLQTLFREGKKHRMEPERQRQLTRQKERALAAITRLKKERNELLKKLPLQRQKPVKLAA